MDTTRLIGLALLAFVAFNFFQKNPTPDPTPIQVIEALPELRTPASALTMKLKDNKASARDFAGFYTELLSSVRRDTSGEVYPTMDRFANAHRKALLCCYQNKPDLQRFNVGAEIDRVLELSIGSLKPQKIDETNRDRLCKGLEAVIWGFNQVE